MLRSSPCSWRVRATLLPWPLNSCASCSEFGSVRVKYGKTSLGGALLHIYKRALVGVVYRTLQKAEEATCCE